MLKKEEKAKVIRCCNQGLITDESFNPENMYHNEWFLSLFDFIDDAKIREQLGEAFYQARFTYKLMQVLSLKQPKNRGIVKFQIIQYASICEGLLNYTLSQHFKSEFEKAYASHSFTDCTQALSGKTQITYDGKKVILCTEKVEKAKLQFASNPLKSAFALEKGIITESTKRKYCTLYDLRNNAHILKAAKADYHPNINEAKEAYALCFDFINEVKSFYLSRLLPTESASTDK